MKKTLLFFWELIKIALIALIIVVPIRTFIFQPFFVRGASMEPNFHDFDYLIVDEISYRFSEPKRGDVVVFQNPLNPKQKFIKRIVGLPLESVKINDGEIKIGRAGEYFIFDESFYLSSQAKNFKGVWEAALEENEYFVLGDNRLSSFDSRSFGPIARKNIVGKVALRIWPISAFADN